MEEADQIAKYRALAINELVIAASGAFISNEDALLNGQFADEIIGTTPYKANIASAKELAKRKLYWSDRKTKLEIAGTEVIHGLLDIFQGVVTDLDQCQWDAAKLKGKSQRLGRLLKLSGIQDRYSAIQRVTDFISGMTDRYAVDLFRNLKGISTGS